MTRDEITKFVAELVAGYDMEPEDAAALHEMGKLAALRAPAVTGEAELRAAAQAIYEAYGPAGDYGDPYRQAWERLRAALAAPPAAGAPLDDMRRRWARCAEQSDRYLAQLEAHGIVPDDNCRQTPPKPAAGAPPALTLPTAIAVIRLQREALKNLRLACVDLEDDLPIEGSLMDSAAFAEQAADAALADAGSPAPAPEPPPIRPDYVVQRRFMGAFLPETAESLRDAQPAPVAPPAETRHGYGCPSDGETMTGPCAYCCPHGHVASVQPEPCKKCSPAPPAVAGGDAPEIQVGDVVIEATFPNDGIRVTDEDQAQSCNLYKSKMLAIYREPLWRRRQEGQ